MLALLKKHFGYDSFRDGQEELVTAIRGGRDTLGIMPTGAGKSLCFQLPALSFEGITLVVSPLISLMKDQVDALRQSGVAAAFLNSSLSERQMELALRNAANGMYKIIYVAPERLPLPEFIAFAQRADISMLVVDEAHCISQWGQDFRPSYARIPAFIDALPVRPVVAAFTATATARVREDILQLLELRDALVLVTGFDRANLYFDVQRPRDKAAALQKFLRTRQDKNGIVYCGTRKTVEEVCAWLNAEGVYASRYHAGLSDEERKQNQDDFLFDRVQVMVATNAFGMGIDKSNVGFVVHYNMPKDIESYYQEAGRAGRDGSDADCLLLYSAQDTVLNRWMIENATDMTYQDAEAEERLKALAYKRLREMTTYATTNDCLRAYILRYFGEQPPADCDNCGNCHASFETVDITIDAQQIVSCVQQMRERFGAKLVVEVLRGAKNERIRTMRLDVLPTYGVSMRNINALNVMIDFLMQNEYLVRTDDQRPVLRLGQRAEEALAGEATILMKLSAEQEDGDSRVSARKKRTASDMPPEREPLFKQLRALRAEIAREQSVPAFVVFSDKALADMCVRLPLTREAFREVHGVGTAKSNRYGDEFIQEIKAFCEETSTEGEQDMTIAVKNVNMEDITIQVEPVSLSAVLAEVNEILARESMNKLTANRAAAWLASEGYLRMARGEKGNARVPTEKGIALGIVQVEREGKAGAFFANYYNEDAQRFVIQNAHVAMRYEP